MSLVCPHFFRSLQRQQRQHLQACQQRCKYDTTALQRTLQYKRHGLAECMQTLQKWTFKSCRLPVRISPSNYGKKSNISILSSTSFGTMNTELAVTQHEPEPECRLSSSETATILAWRSGSEPGEPLPDQCFLRWQSVGFKDVKLKLLRTPNTPPFTFTTERASWIVQPAVNLAMDILACPRGRKVLTMMVQELPEEIKDPVVYQIGPKAIVQQFLLRLRENFAKVYITDSLQRDVQIWSLVWGHDSSELSRFLTWRPSSEVSVFLRRHVRLSMFCLHI